MTGLSRRRFLKTLGAAAGLLLFPQTLFTQTAGKTDFEMLVVGDSFIWGQGLREKDKFYTLVKDWLERDLFGATRRVNLKVKAHSGARIYIHEDQLAEMLECGEDPEKFHYPEADLSFPSITFQIDAARREYETGDAVGLVMLSGGITDLVVGNAVNPFLREGKMRRLIHRYSHAAMANLLDHIAEVFPRALVVVVGYFPIVSTKSDVNTLTKYLMKIVKFPHPLQFLLTNLFSKQFMKIVRKATAERSRIWVYESNKELRDAVREANEKSRRERVVFVESPITEENCFATKNSLLFGMNEDNKPEDELYAERLTECPKVFREIKYRPFGLISERMCELASVAHPNKAGARAYAEAIETRLGKFFRPL
ncbi:MAG: SGNH/GDSL hydrolase family protein [Acidobacteria bacterium]|nr:SGNH/GDSL hydrolase family protein [Acidobacteriota bacterium]